MELRNPGNGETLEKNEEPPNPGNGELPRSQNASLFSDDIDSNCSTPYVSAPSSPGRGAGGAAPGGYFFSCPASPMHYVLSSAPFSVASGAAPPDFVSIATAGSFEFEGAAIGSMISADELFLNGQIRPMKLSSHLQRPQVLAPLLDLDVEEEERVNEGETGGRGRESRLRSRSVHRRARSMSPLRNARFQWREEEDEEHRPKDTNADDANQDPDLDPKDEEAVAPSDSGPSSRSSSSGRNSKRWIFLKDLLYRSKSEGTGRGNGKEKEKFWHSISFSPSKDKLKSTPIPPSSEPSKKEKNKKNVASTTAESKPSNGVGKRRGPAPSAHERHYTAKRAQAEELRKRTFLPYRQGLLGCLGFSSRGYGAVNGFAKTLNPVS